MATEESAPATARKKLRVGVAIAAAVAAIAAVLAVVLSGGGGPMSTPTPTAAPVVLAASVTTHQAGFRFTIDIAVTAGHTTQDIRGSGAVSERPQLAVALHLALGGRPYDALMARPWEYVEVNGSWYKINLDAYRQSLGAGGLSASSDPSQLLGFLGATGTVTRVGSETIDGVPTTHYHAVTDLGRYAATVPASERAAAATAIASAEHSLRIKTLPIDAWVDAQHRVRRLVLALSSICTASGPLDEAVTMTFSDYGPQSVPAPPTGAVPDITSQAAAQAAQSQKQLACA